MSVLDQGFEIIGNFPKTRVLYALPVEALLPSPIKKRGRKRIYGVKMTPEEVQKLPETTIKLRLYGKVRNVAFRSCICRARFLKGRIVRVVWRSFINDKGKTENNIKMAGYALLQLLTICMNTAALKVARIDWRKTDTITADMARQALKLIIPRFGIRGCWNRYEQQLELIFENQHERTQSSPQKAA